MEEDISMSLNNESIIISKDEVVYKFEEDDFNEINNRISKQENNIITYFRICLSLCNEEKSPSLKLVCKECSNNLNEWRQFAIFNATVDLSMHCDIEYITRDANGKVLYDSKIHKIDTLKKYKSDLLNPTYDDFIPVLFNHLKEASQNPQLSMYYYGLIWDIALKNNVINFIDGICHINNVDITNEEWEIFKLRNDHNIHFSRHSKTKNQRNKRFLTVNERNTQLSIAKKIVTAYILNKLKK